MIDRPPPPVATTEGGATGVLISGPYVPDVPDMAVDGVVASGLKNWLTFEERRSLAMASERAAIATTGASVAWEAHDGSGALTAQGGAAPTGDVFRSLRGNICRDVRQSVDKSGEPHAQTVTLCREPLATGVTIWVVAAD